MPVLTPAAMPPVILPFSAQLNFVTDFVKTCQQPARPDPAALAQRWKRLDEAIVRTSGATSPDASVIEDPEQIPSFADGVRSLARGMFDPQIERFLREGVSDRLVVKEHLNYARISEAAAIGTVSREPAAALIESLNIYNGAHARYELGRFLTPALLAVGAMTTFLYPVRELAAAGWSVEGKGVISLFVPALAFLFLGLVTGIMTRVSRNRIAPLFNARM